MSSPRAWSAPQSFVRSLVAAALAACAGTLAAGATGACANVDTERETQTQGPPYDQFKSGNVSGFLEARCGTLDCHGQLGRPLRIYGLRGLRLENDAGRTSGIGGTDDSEVRANYFAVVGLEPEVMRRVFEEGGDAPERLMIVQKPRNEVAHKGGAVVGVGEDDGDRCMLSWLASNVDKRACDEAVKVVQQRGGE